MRVGFTRMQVEALLGKPDVYVSGLDNPSKECEDAYLWYYAGVQFHFQGSRDAVLSDIGFKPFYLSPNSQYRDIKRESAELDLWIFGTDCNLTVDKLKAEFQKGGIIFQDTGLESCVFNDEIKNFQLIPYERY